MMFTLLRAGLPNTIVVAALAAMPIVAVALSPSARPPQATAQASVAAADVPGDDHADAD